MPIRPDLRHLYRTPEYVEARARVVERSGDRCEECRKPNSAIVETISGASSDCRDGWLKPFSDTVFMWWRGIGPWTDHHGVEYLGLVIPAGTRRVKVVLTMAHLDHDPTNNADDNLKFLCQWCHLHYDQLHHKETRSTRKDRQRPLLQA